jgi:hypothetical protein
MPSSTASNASTIVSFRGDDAMELDTCLNTLYSDIQQQLNYSQCSVRSLAASSEQDNEFLIAAEIHFELLDHLESLIGMFNELKSVSKQCLGPVPKEFKVEYKKLCDDRKLKQKKDKDDMKMIEIKMKELASVQE